ncbi:MAG: PASTA domain-containing protein [Streptosporangiales bacterium]
MAAEPVEVPQVHGRPDSARDKLLSLGLIVAGQVLETISDKPSGTVVGSYPPAGSLVPPATSIQLAVSNAVEVPPVIGFSVEQAEEVLSEAGFRVSTSTEGDGGGYLVVRHQSPEGGFWVPRRSTVSLVLGAPEYAESGTASATARTASRATARATAGGTAAGRRRSRTSAD